MRSHRLGTGKEWEREQWKAPGRGGNGVRTTSILAHNNYNAIVFYVPNPARLGRTLAEGPEGVLHTTYQSICEPNISAENPGLLHFKEEPGMKPTVVLWLCVVRLCTDTA